jgi:hypothetical protein
MSGCHFAVNLAAAGARITYWTVHDALRRVEVRALEEIIDGSAKEGRWMIVLFPHLRTAKEVAQLLEVLRRSDRWEATRVEWRKHARANTTPIGLTFRTASNWATSVMGFAPLGTMPVTRRAPYTAFALWPNGPANPFMRTKEKGAVIGFIDGPHDLDEDKRPTYDAWLNTSRGRVDELFAVPPEDRVWLRQVAFCLPRNAAKHVTLK